MKATKTYSLSCVKKQAVKKGAILPTSSKRKATASVKQVSTEEVEEIVSNYREHTRSKLAKDFPEIVDTMLRSAKAGKLTDAKLKLLLDLAGVKDHPEGESAAKKGPGLGELLLNEIKMRRQSTQEMFSDSKAMEVNAGVFSGSNAAECAALCHH
jgi:hypothetical protein